MRTLLPTVIIVILLGYAYTVFAQVWTDHLWFQSLGYHQVFTTRLGTQVLLFLIAGAFMGAAVGVNIWLCLKTTPLDVTSHTTAQASFHNLAGRWRRLVIVLPAAALGLLTGASWIGNATTVLAWLNQVPFGQADARFGLDVAFYVFDYPWYRAVVGLFLAVTVLCAIIALAGHFLNGSFLADVGGRRQTARAAHLHVGILLGLITAGYGVTKLLDRYGVLVTSGQLLDGLTYTSDHARLTANLVLAIIAGLTAILFFATAAGRGWRLPLVSVALVVVSSLIIGGAYPLLVQSFQVNPTEPDKERPYMEMNIAATRAAYGIENVQIEDYSAVTTAEAGQLKSDAEALPGIRLIDPQMVQDTFEQLQQVRGYYTFSPVLDVDRYVIDGQETDVVLAAREMDHSGLDKAVQNWNNLHTVYTHGYGLVAAYGNKRQADGEPEWLARDIPTVGALSASEPRIYYGEMTKDYAIVGREDGQDPIEYDTPGGGAQTGEQYNTYTGTGGVPVGNLGNRLLYATRFASVNLLLSDRVNAQSKILYDRTPQERVHDVAPWLTTDSDIYPAIVDGRIVWIVDAYTTSLYYPNSERVTVEDALSDSLTDPSSAAYALTSEINYIRNSVKAVVDAYDGSVSLYAWDESDPILQTWMKVFPGSVQPKSAISDDLMAHLRYPEDLFKIQRQMLARYHMTSPESWYSQSDLWRIPSYPVQERNTSKEPTYFLSIKWPDATVNGETVPGDAGPLFSQTTVYTPNNRLNLSAYMSVVAEATSPSYGTIRILRMSDTQQIDGPGQAYNAMMANEQVSSVLLPYSSDGAAAKALKGNLLTIPLGGGLLYVEPIYTRQVSTDAAYPILRFVVVRFGTHVAIDTTLQGALDKVFSGDAGATTGEDNVPPSTGTGTGQPGQTGQTGPDTSGQTKDQLIQSALKEAETQFTAAQTALQNGDLAGYQAANKAAQAAVQRALQAMGQ
ncbi:MAG: UPF0182 family protein [Propionibacteriaceae bacterium]|jgi:uncharacterized membrane protein (UPF0182 family)|nr:UPF0182 family protein [Propionibacteriaceae bacterium]